MFKSKKSNSLPEINTTALPDIIFMLLFFFMVVTVIKKEDSDNRTVIPKVDYAQLLKKGDIFAVAIHKDDDKISYQLGQQHFQTINNLEAALSKKYMSNGPEKVKLVADRTVSMADINAVKQILQRSQYFGVEYLVSVGE